MRFFSKDDGDGENFTEIDELHQAVQAADMPPEVVKTALKEIERIAKMGPSSAEYTIGINYIDYLTSLPWNRSSEDRLDLEAAKEILDSEHYGLAELKNRILEHLAVRIMHKTRCPRMLVVDDEEITRKNLEHVLTKEGYQVFSAADGAAALALINQHVFDVILTDLKMEKNRPGNSMIGSARKCCPMSAVQSRPTSSRRTRDKTPVSFRLILP